MRAMVICAGEGTRLRPLTQSLPKPLVPVANRPVLEYTLLNLKKHGITDVIINLSHSNKKVQEYFKDGSSLGLQLFYSFEKELLGTAGGVKNAEHYFLSDSDPNVLVVSGDNLTDIDFSNLIQFHNKKKSDFSIAVTAVDSRFEYGVTLFGKDARIEKFLEKPTWGDIFCNTVNSGIYIFKKEILKEIPKNRFYDFGHDLLPKLLLKKKALYGYKFDAYWTDIGTLAEYKKSQAMVLNRKIETAPRGELVRKGVWIGKETKISKSARINPPCSIGDNCTIKENVTIGPYTVIGDRCIIGRKSVILHSILWGDCRISGSVKLVDSVVLTQRVVPPNLSVSGGLVLDEQI